MSTVFAGFDPTIVSDFGQDEVERLLADPRVVRSKAKIEATIDNAQALLELDAEHGGFDRYLSSRVGFAETVADLKRQFRFIGDSGAYHFLWSVDEPTPPYKEWFSAKRRRGPRRRQTAGAERRRRARSAS